MEDEKIIELYWQRDESAISETAAKYGSYCAAIAGNILTDSRDAEECVNDTYMRAWESMPPKRPALLRAFLGRITRDLSLSRWRKKNTAKRGGGQLPLIFDELSECVSGTESTEGEFDKRELLRAIDGFLGALPDKKRGMFLRRYWRAESIESIAVKYGISVPAVTMALSRIRADLRVHLRKEGFDL